MKSFFITGTDTDCGKTYVTCQLIDHLKHAGRHCLAIKPIASGCRELDGQMVSDDVIHLQKHNAAPQHEINGWRFAPPVSPHIAAQQTGVSISASDIATFCLQEKYRAFDHLLIEGAGGLLVPLNHEETWLDFLKLTKIPTILVVGMKLGCINHALLTDAVLQHENLHCIGWIANCLQDNMLALSENIATLSQKMTVPLLATVSFQGKLIPNRFADALFM